MSQLKTEDDSFDWNTADKNRTEYNIEFQKCKTLVFKNTGEENKGEGQAGVTYLEYRSAVRRAPGVQQVVFARRHEPFTARGETQGQYTRLVQMELVLVRFQGM